MEEQSNVLTFKDICNYILVARYLKQGVKQSEIKKYSKLSSDFISNVKKEINQVY